MTTLASEFRSGGMDLPAVAFARAALAPVVCVGCLGTSMLAFGEPFTLRYAVLGIAAFFVAAQRFDGFALGNGGTPFPAFLPGRAILTDWLIVCGVLLLVAFATKATALYSRKVLLTWLVVTPFALQAAQELARPLLYRLASSLTATRTRVMVGLNERACELARKLNEDPCGGVSKGYFDDRNAARLPADRPGVRLGRLATVAEYVKRNSINIVYITLPMSQHPRIVRLLDGLRDTTASIYFVPAALPFDFLQARIDRIGGVPVIGVCESPFCGMNGAVKRAVDVALGGFLLLVAAPLMLAIALGVRASSPGPILFKQRRYGLDGKEILVYKFRTMTVCEDGDRITQARRSDPRVTRFGALLRQSSLDELPQLLNVLEGTMSIVGPRPHAVAHNEQYRRLIDGYMIRHKVRPGITGWAQVNGLRGETGTVEQMKRRIDYDLDYLRHWSLGLDVWIILRTPFVMLRGAHAY
jgi:putative colanic acid biosynthesis UDP-glucose lipid carrier transferase